jgi:mannitol-specific phosphotransferase system IIBC component
VSAIVGVASVAIIFLVQMLIFNERVLAEKDKTVKTLQSNNNNIANLQSSIRALDANQALIDSRANPDDRAIQAILDALPADSNADALGASLQKKLLTNINVTSLQVDNSGSSNGEIKFRFSVSGDDNSLKRILMNLEKSIRIIDVTSFRIESQGTTRLLTVQARAFYEPARVVELKDKVVR